MKRLIVKFTKDLDVKYISHLDLMRVFERALRRAIIPIAYTQGFNPRPRMSFAAPLALGVSSQGEYLELELDQDMDLKDFTEALNKTLPIGIEILKVEVIEKTEKALMAQVQWAEYLIIVHNPNNITYDNLKDNISKLMMKDAIKVLKEGKDGIAKEVDIRSGIDRIEVVGVGENIELNVLIASGSRLNIRPEHVVDSIFKEMGIDSTDVTIQIKRLELYKEINNKKIPFMP